MVYFYKILFSIIFKQVVQVDFRITKKLQNYNLLKVLVQVEKIKKVKT